MNEDDDDLSDMHVYNSYKFDLQFTRILSEHIVSSKMKFNIDYAVNPDADDDDLVKAWNKIHIWLDMVHQSVLFSAGNPLAIATLLYEESARYNNLLMILPGEPTEELIGYVMQAKLTALSSDTMIFGSVQMEAEEATGITTAIAGDYTDRLPVMAEWVGLPNWFSKPWWERDDGSMLDSEAGSDVDLTDLPEWAFPWAFEQPKPKPSGVVVSGSFKPKFVEDENDDS